jgi:hypothetical protein
MYEKKTLRVFNAPDGAQYAHIPNKYQEGTLVSQVFVFFSIDSGRMFSLEMYFCSCKMELRSDGFVPDVSTCYRRIVRIGINRNSRNITLNPRARVLLPS